MAQSNKFGSILLNTSNKSEIAVGYGTLYGDLCGGISVIGDVYKTDVFKLARFSTAIKYAFRKQSSTSLLPQNYGPTRKTATRFPNTTSSIPFSSNTSKSE